MIHRLTFVLTLAVVGCEGDSDPAPGAPATTGAQETTTNASADATDDGADSTGMLPPDDSALQEACEAYCAAVAEPDCESFIGEELCLTACVNLGTEPFCVEEAVTAYGCLGSVDYECHETAGSPFPVGEACTTESVELSNCASDVACDFACLAANEQGCDYAQDVEACAAECRAERVSLPPDCERDFDDFARCISYEDAAACSGLLQTDHRCADPALEVGKCLERGASSQCEAWCWAAEHIECGPADCVSFCEEQSGDTACGSEFVEMVDCMLFFGEGVCFEDRFLGASICDGDTEAYRACAG